MSKCSSTIRSVKTLLSNKHKAIAAKLFEVLQRKTKEFAETIVAEFSDMYGRLIIVPHNIEAVAEMKDYIATLQQRIDSQHSLV